MDAVTLFATFSLLLGLFKSAETVTVSTSKASVVAHENSNAVLSCEFKTEKDPHPRIEWKKKGKDVAFVYFDGKFRDAYAKRASIDGATVTLQSVTQKDSGVYRCEVTARLDHVPLGEVDIALNVLVPPHTPSCEIPATAVSGLAAELHCRDEHSIPAATYSWYKDNRPLTSRPDAHYSLDPQKGSLKFKTVSKFDAGRYRCESSNGVGAPKSCAGQDMKVIEIELSLKLLLAAGGGAAGLLLLCCLGGCLCYRRGCCCRRRRRPAHEEKRRGNQNIYSPPPQEVSTVLLPLRSYIGHKRGY
ncbi:junctional adhesion molecule 2b isoform X2 [Denticeps clupeoides]|uniref:junctional adhesion molecule 2b isoform X2 n=1 Tax=Denticeps clupeoides TaxID=299321 RepID=UPI0010A416B6|nr:junctional adhesion molecule B-like isoform X2 [Denticeps clupeoides]